MFKLRFNLAWVAYKLLDEVIMELLESEKRKYEVVSTTLIL